MWQATIYLTQKLENNLPNCTNVQSLVNGGSGVYARGFRWKRLVVIGTDGLLIMGVEHVVNDKCTGEPFGKRFPLPLSKTIFFKCPVRA
jgi:hypothetical protein